jgi:hypothetical protein
MYQRAGHQDIKIERFEACHLSPVPGLYTFPAFSESQHIGNFVISYIHNIDTRQYWTRGP